MPDETPLSTHLDHLALYAGNFITHWMEDDGNDADDKARCTQAEEATDDAETKLRAALAASTAMLAALELAAPHREKGTILDAMQNAITQARAAGITTE